MPAVVGHIDVRVGEMEDFEHGYWTTYIDLSDDPRYMDNYTASLFLPHTDLDRFPSVKKSGK